MIVSVIPLTTDGKTSGTKTFRIICQFVEPIARAAVITPGSISISAVSITRATKGAAARLRGIIVAEVPIAVPRTKRVNGRRTIIKITKGKERKTSIMRLKTILKRGFGIIPVELVIKSRIPSGKPIITAKSVEKNTICRVWRVEIPTNSNI